ncbi:hypothetical protein QE450_004305 [Paenibacillus sp. SORGH_AS306]|uniref:hypothetical protein n=1 Tax=unclassified Paenibacillus TaxID=185978 RepID=UPI00278A7944|nr:MULTISPECIES: hypothetical protein [unclassified Paenibacillus]MDQ1236807.1 hypothetical protein [Paenibacillus sp. SORGH_AS_0306]MDR6109168.1 hypothetical protein [Paenibacillus sp. SORGH_AS_0338]
MKKDQSASKDYYYRFNGHDTSGAIVNSYGYDEWGNIDPLLYTDPTGHVSYKGLNGVLSDAIRGTTPAGVKVTNDLIAQSIIDGTGRGGIYLAFHQIAQVQAGKVIHQTTGQNTTLELELGNFRVDIVSGKQMWEVKPGEWSFLDGFGGEGMYENAEKQLAKYEETAKAEGTPLKRGFLMENAIQTHIYGDLNMQVRSIDQGKIIYEFYYNIDGKIYWTTTGGARDYISDNFTFASDILESEVPGPNNEYSPSKGKKK